MLSSMSSHPVRGRRPVVGGRREPGSLLSALAIALVTVVVGLVVGLGAVPAMARPLTSTAVAAVKCAGSPPAADIDPAIVPWPQARYDLAAVGQITQGAGITVAVVDSGVSPTAPQLGTAVVGGGDMLDSTGDGRDDCVGHGTSVASIIAARPVAGAGLRGLAPAAKILAVRVSERIQTENGPSGVGDVKDLAAGIRAAVSRKAQVINLSIATGVDNADLRAAIQSALDADIVVIAAVGNGHNANNPIDREDAKTYPASYDGVVGVGAIRSDGTRVDSSQVGSFVDIVAPGDDVIGAIPGGGYVNWEGTSFATPYVAATAALIRAHWPGMSRIEVVRRLLATADPAAGGRPSIDYGYGVVNPLRALTEVLPPPQVAKAVSPSPAFEPGLANADDGSAPSVAALTLAGVLLVAAAAIAAVSAVLPVGRRRGWKPGRVDPTPPLLDTPTPASPAGQPVPAAPPQAR